MKRKSSALRTFRLGCGSFFCLFGLTFSAPAQEIFLPDSSVSETSVSGEFLAPSAFSLSEEEETAIQSESAGTYPTPIKLAESVPDSLKPLEAPLPPAAPSGEAEKGNDSGEKEISIKDLQKSLDKLQGEMKDLKADLKKKQNAPDPNKKFTSKLGGFLELDTVTVDQDELNQDFYGDIDNDFAVRDVRLWAKGEGYGNLSYEVAFGFAGCLSFKNVMLTAQDLPWLNTARIGYFKVESGLNYQQNVYDNTFVDWETTGETFQLGRRLGFGSIHYSQNKNARLFTGIFTGRNLQIGDKKHANENSDDPGVILNTRLTAVPIYREAEDGTLCEVFHLGGGFRWVDPGRDPETGDSRKTTLQSSPTDWLSDMPSLLYGEISTNSYSVTNIEAAWQRNRLGVVSEGFVGRYNGYDDAYGVSATGRFLLTPGAYQKYNKENGCFAGVNIPENMRFVDYENCRCLEGFGVWEIAGQWSWTDLDMLRDAPGNPIYGRINQYTVALNWYWNPQTRWGINWIWAKPIAGRSGADETGSTLNTLALQSRITF